MSEGERDRVVVIGSGQAGGEFAAGLRARGYTGAVTIVGAEDHVPYSRPPLSKAYLRGEVPAGDLYLRPEAFYRERDIDVLTGTTVASIDVAEHLVRLSDGSTLRWDKLVLATGGTPRRLPVAKLDSATNVHYIRTIGDVDRLRAAAVHGSRFVVVGGGFVGLEITSVLRGLGAEVTVLELGDRLLGRVTSPVVSAFFRRLHEEEGVEIRLAAQVTDYTLDGAGAVVSVVLGDGTSIPVDQMLVGIGMLPNDDLASQAGIETENGVVVDGLCRTSQQDVYAIGDVTRHPDSRAGGLRRLESMANAAAQARVVADFLTGVHAPYEDLPWFWSDQYDVKLQTAGILTGYDDLVVRGDPSSARKFSVWYLKQGRVHAVDAISSPADYAVGKRLIEGADVVDATALSDLSKPLRSLLVSKATSAG